MFTCLQTQQTYQTYETQQANHEKWPVHGDYILIYHDNV